MITTKSRNLIVRNSHLHFCYMKQSILCYSIWIVVQVIRELWSREGFLTSCWGYATCGLSSNLTSGDMWFSGGRAIIRESWIQLADSTFTRVMRQHDGVHAKIWICREENRNLLQKFFILCYYVNQVFLSFLNCSVKRVC